MEVAIDKNLAEFVGILLGDGSIGKYRCQNKNGKNKIYRRIKITGNAQEDLLYYKLSVIPLFRKLFNKEPLLRFKKGEKTCELLLFDRRVFNYLTNDLGMKLAPKKDRAIIPKEVLTKDLENYLLRGYFDTDGSLVLDKQNYKKHSYPRLEIKSAPAPMRQQFLNILKKHGYRFIISPKDRKTNDVLRIQINGKTMLKKWLKEVGFNNPRHKTKYLIWKRYGFCPPHTEISERFQILKGTLDPYILERERSK